MSPEKPIVCVAWEDAHGSIATAYSEHEIPHASVVILTIGWLLRQDEVGISVANEYCGDGTWRGVTFVPHGMMQSVTPILTRTPRKKRVKPEPAPVEE